MCCRVGKVFGLQAPLLVWVSSEAQTSDGLAGFHSDSFSVRALLLIRADKARVHQPESKGQIGEFLTIEVVLVSSSTGPHVHAAVSFLPRRLDLHRGWKVGLHCTEGFTNAGVHGHQSPLPVSN